MKILLVEDDQVLGDALSVSLEEAGYAVDWAQDGQKANIALQNDDYDAVVLDLGLPKMSGLDVLQHARIKKIKIPIIIVSARESVEDRVRGLDLGADDYLSKPFKFSELEARLRALIRRSHGATINTIQFGPLTFNTKDRVFIVGDQRLELSKRELGLLEVLILKNGECVAKESILEKLYNWDEEITENAIEVYVHRVRSKLKPYGINIDNRRGLGYRLSFDQS